MMTTLSRIVFVLTSVVILFWTSTSIAQNKAVIVPLGGSGITMADMATSHVWRGRVGFDGSKLSTGRYSVSRIDTGYYYVSLDLNIEGLNTDASVLTGYAVPIVSLQDVNSASSVELGLVSRSIGVDNTVIDLGFYVWTRDSSGTPADGYFAFQAMIEEPDASGSPRKGILSPADNSSGMACTKDLAKGVETCVENVLN